MGDVNRAGLASIFDGDLVCAYRNDVGGGGLSDTVSGLAFVLVELVDDSIDGGIGLEGLLASESRFNSVGKSEPVLLRGRGERTEGTNDLVARTFGSEDRLDEEIVDVGLAGGVLGGLLDEQACL
jgi:hypothetical protein